MPARLEAAGVIAIGRGMVFWVIAALLTLAASLAVMRPFLRKNRHSADGGEYDLAVYRDQLSELEQEVRRGIISETDAQEARAEIGRRILRLKQADEAGKEPGSRHAKAVAAIAMAGVLAVPLISWGAYLLLGSPGLPSLPLQARLQQDPSQASIEELIARAEAYLANNPQDARGWEVLAPIYARLGRFGDAATAYRKIIALEGATAERESALGEAMVGEAGGIVTADAEATFERALELDQGNPRARFYMAMAKAQEGDTAAARALWDEMARGLPDDSPWKQAAGQAARGLAASERAGPGGPSQDELADAENMTPEARQAMIEGMVASLDAKLRDNPADLEGWRRLVRSYVVLDRRDEAEKALDRALAALGPESEDAKTLVEYASSLGIGERE